MKKLHIFFLFIFPFIFYAQQNLTANEFELIGLSLEKSYELKNASNELMMDSIDTRVIKQNFIPTLSMNGMYAYGASKINVDIPTFTLPISGTKLFEGTSEFDVKGNFFNTNLTAKALLFSGLQVTYGSKANNEKIKAKNFMLDKEKADIIKDVIDTFDKIALLKQAELVLNESQKRLDKEKERVTKAIKYGLAIPYDRQKITAAELKIDSKKAELYGNLDLLYLKLEMLTGKDLSVLKTYYFNLSPWKLIDEENSFGNRPELKALDASIEAFNYKLKMNKNAFLPKVQAFASLSYFNLFNAETSFDGPLTGNPIDLDLNHFEGFPTYMLGVGFEWELFNGLKHSNEIQKTTIEKDIAQNKKEDASEKLELFEKKAKIDFNVKNRQILLKEKEKEVASNTLNLAIKSYQEGLIDISERLLAETDHQTAVLEYYKMIALQRKAALELLIATGSLNLNNLK
jgi:outer membrane protein TolC